MMMFKQLLRWRYPALGLLMVAVIAAVIGSSALINHSTTCALGIESPQPACITLPQNTTLVKTEHLYLEQIQNWYFTIPQFSNNNLQTYYTQQFSGNGWRCFSTMQSLNNQKDGQPITGSGVYITAQKNHIRVQINSGDQEFGSLLLQDDVPDGGIALKISLESNTGKPC
jgi:hypothetical protein